jgi:hypothetical protein
MDVLAFFHVFLAGPVAHLLKVEDRKKHMSLLENGT